MSRPKKILAIASVLVLFSGVGVGLLALYRVQQSIEYSQPNNVATYEGTNYVLRLLETMVGKTDTACVVIVYLRIENPNPFNLKLWRPSFLLADRYRFRYSPSTMGTQTEWIKVPANGIREREMLSFTVPEDVFEGSLILVTYHSGKILIKDTSPYELKLRTEEFKSFRRPSW